MLRDKVFLDTFETIEHICKIIKRNFSSEEVVENYSPATKNPSLIEFLDTFDVITIFKIYLKLKKLKMQIINYYFICKYQILKKLKCVLFLYFISRIK